MKLHLYARVSTDQQETSATVQEQRLRAFAATSGLDLAGAYVDEDVSGAKPLKERPAGKRLWDAVERGDTVAFCKVDRAFRSLMDAANTLDVWKKLGVHVVILDVGIDVTSAVGEFFFNNLVSFAQLERALLGQRLKETFSFLRREGRPFSNYRPYGWQRVGSGKNQRFAPLDSERALGQRVVGMRKQGLSWAAIATAFFDEGITKPGKAKAARAGRYRGAYYLETEVRRLYQATLAGFPLAPRSTRPMAAKGRDGQFA